MAAEGELDTSFGPLGDGRIVFGHDIPANGLDTPMGMTVDAQGRVYTVGLALDGANWRATVTRLTAAGTLDTGFGGDGKIASTDTEGSFLAADITRDTLGQLVVAGSRVFGNFTNGDRDFLVCRFNTAGTAVDFGPPTNTHCRTFPFDLGGTNIDQVKLIRTWTDGSMYLVGHSQDSNNVATAKISIVKLTSTGALDNSFNGTGKLSFGHPSGSQAFIHDADVASDGSLYLGGYVSLNGNRDALVVKVRSNGNLDSNFSTDGFKDYPLDLGGSPDLRDDTAYSIALTSDGKFVLGGEAELNLQTNVGFLIRASASTGLNDSSFGEPGSGEPGTARVGFERRIVDLLVQADNRILMAITRGSDDFNVVSISRYDTDATDPTFGIGGASSVVFDQMEHNDSAVKMALSNGRVVVLGAVNRENGNGDFGVARLKSDAMFANRFE